MTSTMDDAHAVVQSLAPAFGRAIRDPSTDIETLLNMLQQSVVHLEPGEHHRALNRVRKLLCLALVEVHPTTKRYLVKQAENAPQTWPSHLHEWHTLQCIIEHIQFDKDTSLSTGAQRVKKEMLRRRLWQYPDPE